VDGDVAAPAAPASPSAAPRGRPPYRWVVLAAAAATQVAFSALQTGLPALGPALRIRFGLSLPELGAVLGATSLGTVGTVYWWGVLADRVGERRVLLGGLLGSAAALVAASAAPSPLALAVALLVAGGFGGCTGAASARAVIGWFGPEERGFALSARHTGVPLGAASAAIALPPVAAVAGVPGAFIVLAGLAAAGAAAAGVFIREPLFEHEEPLAPGGPAPLPRRDRRLWRLAVGCALLVAPQYSLGAFFPVFLHDRLGWSQGAAGAGLAVGLGLSAAGRLAAGRWSDRRRHRVAPLRSIAMAGAATAGAAALLTLGPAAVAAPVLLVTLVLVWSWNGLAFAAAGEISGPAQAGAALGLLTTVLFGVGAIAPTVFGAIVEAGSWPAGMAAVVVATLAAWRVLAPLGRAA
jgi:sugar phosphate permease